VTSSLGGYCQGKIGIGIPSSTSFKGSAFALAGGDDRKSNVTPGPIIGGTMGRPSSLLGKKNSGRDRERRRSRLAANEKSALIVMPAMMEMDGLDRASYFKEEEEEGA